MGWQFRKSFRLLPGVRINLSKRGVSTTFGSSPFSVNVGRRGITRTVSIPGTGLYHRAPIDISSDGGESAPEIRKPSRLRIGCALLVWAFLLPILALAFWKAETTDRLYTTTVANCRSAARLSAPVVETLYRGKAVTAHKDSGGFRLVEFGIGKQCYVASRLLSETDPIPTPPKEKKARAWCPCSLPANCTGPSGGTFCRTPSGGKRYR